MSALTILPEKEFLVLSAGHTKYFLAAEEELDGCLPAGDSLACVPPTAIKSAETRPICETEILRDPSNETLRTCNVRITHACSTQWTALTHQNTWLFSTCQPEIFDITCKGTKLTNLRLDGAGILDLSPDCTASNRFETILSLGEFDTNVTGMLPEASLSLRSLSPAIIDSSRPEALKGDTINRRLPIDVRARWGSGLNQVESELSQIGLHHQEQRRTKIWFFSIAGIVGILTSIIAALGIYKCGIRRATCGLLKLCQRHRSLANISSGNVAPLTIIIPKESSTEPSTTKGTSPSAQLERSTGTPGEAPVPAKRLVKPPTRTGVVMSPASAAF